MNENASDNMTSAGTLLPSHEGWCNRAEHAQRAAESPDPVVGCVSTALEVPGKIMGQSPGGWWVQNEPDGATVFALDWNLKFAELSVEDLRFAYQLLLTVGRKEIDTALQLIAAALTEYDGQHPADAESAL